MVKIKICGITNLEDAEKAVSLGANALGFVFADSPRKIDVQKARSIAERVKGRVLCVGVFVNESLDNLLNIADFCSLDAIQLHGEESPEYCSRLKDKDVIKAFRIKDGSSMAAIERYRDVFAYLLDAFSKDVHGGTGKTFDWDLAVKAKAFGKPIILSGGLGVDNVAEAIKNVRPYGVDISSSIELIPGKKDHSKMKELISAIKRLDAECN